MKKKTNKIKTALVENTRTRTELSGWNKISSFMKREETQFFFFSSLNYVVPFVPLT